MKIIWFVVCLLPLISHAGELEVQRQQFLPVYRAAVKGAPPALARLDHLRDYPLYAYLRYYQLRPRLRSLPSAEVRGFLAEYPSSLLAERLRTDWLRETARAGRRDLFVEDYVPQADAELQCHALAIRVRKGQFDGILEALKPLWLVGKSQDKACDWAFAALRARKVLSDELIFARMLLAFRAGNPSLGQHVAKRYATPADRPFGGLLTQVHANPAKTLQLPALQHDSPRTRAIVGYGLGRLARQGVARASTAWEVAGQRYAFTAQEAGMIQRELALAAVAQSHPTVLARLANVDPSAIDDTLERHRLRAGLTARAWEKLASWTAEPPLGATTNPLRWRYWHARSLEELGRNDEAVRAFQALATERDYYGFLACDKVHRNYAMTHHAIAPKVEDRTRVAAHGAIRRAAEFYRLGLRAQANSELNFFFSHNPKRDIEIAAVLVADWGWVERAIAILGQIQSYDDLDLRFPLLHKDVIFKFAKQRGLTPALVYSIIRGESAFVVDAHSSAGALGLMQVLPSTGAATAKHLGLSLATPAELTKIDKNIAIGSEYLRQVLRQFNGSFPLAAAAYNAGPSRVRAWLKTSNCAPPDLWVDTIPFAETEAYVRRALFYAAIYEHRLGETINPLSIRLANLTSTSSAGAGPC
ncbi:MAG: hypothetical protein EXR86_05405 [Gammaproteobacteria bacterium]|nr:hypothetical protein [Gammaproteobacteria bacterium]